MPPVDTAPDVAQLRVYHLRIRRPVRAHEAHARAGDAKLHFHFVGLGAGANYTATNHSNSYGALSSEFLALDALIATAKPGRDVPPTILKVDCEGCEWDAFADAARRSRR